MIYRVFNIPGGLARFLPPRVLWFKPVCITYNISICDSNYRHVFNKKTPTWILQGSEIWGPKNHQKQTSKRRVFWFPITRQYSRKTWSFEVKIAQPNQSCWQILREDGFFPTEKTKTPTIQRDPDVTMRSSRFTCQPLLYSVGAWRDWLVASLHHLQNKKHLGWFFWGGGVSQMEMDSFSIEASILNDYTYINISR